MKPTQEQVIAWAREVGLPKWYQTDGIVNEGLVVKFATLAYSAGRKDENEACIRDCESVDIIGADDCIAAIRARREQ